MRLRHMRKLLVLLVSSAWLPTTITCDPADFEGVVTVVGVPDIVVVDEDHHDGCCDWGDFHFDWWGHHEDDDD